MPCALFLCRARLENALVASTFLRVHLRQNIDKSHTIWLLLRSQSIGGGRLPLCGSYERVLAADDGGIGGSAIDQYLSHSYYDDLAWAAAWLYRASSASHCSCWMHNAHRCMTGPHP